MAKVKNGKAVQSKFKIGKEVRMKKLLKIGAFLIAVTLTLAPTLAQAFNPAAHIYIADQVFKDCSRKINLYYGSIAPDLAMYVTMPAKWPTAFDDTHHDYIDLRSCALGSTQKAFAKGWLTHNEEWGADHYAHGTEGNPGYVIEKAELLLDQTDLLSDNDIDFAHYAIEVAIDLLVKKNDDPNLGGKLLISNLFRSWQDRHLLVKVLVWKKRRTDWLTLATAELTFRNLVGRYALALAISSLEDKGVLVELGVQLAEEMYEIEVTPAEVMAILNAAIMLCEDDYESVIEEAIDGIRSNLN